MQGRCDEMYTGETSWSLKEQISEHRDCIKRTRVTGNSFSEKNILDVLSLNFISVYTFICSIHMNEDLSFVHYWALPSPLYPQFGNVIGQKSHDHIPSPPMCGCPTGWYVCVCMTIKFFFGLQVLLQFSRFLFVVNFGSWKGDRNPDPAATIFLTIIQTKSIYD